ncbi:VolA/Pla-1 family phospholipase [Algicola sagamiensis]|uniref:VolA/Pla-1 family phospholipase n=1 Tax=Algicola sagamiensis TaxID=163869 RepID=UPI00036E795C|nr:VolA/Pla-1 family phospholipase [Algicola sagamiensis]
MKKLVLSLAIAGALNLTGCGSDKLDDHDDKKGTKVAVSRVVFNPAGGELSTPSDILFAGTTDGTLNMPKETAATKEGEKPDYSDPETALGALDGWSIQAPFTLKIDLPKKAVHPSLESDVSIDASTIKGKVLIFPAIAAGPNLGSSPFEDETCAAATQFTGQLCKIVESKALKEGEDFVVQVSGSNIIVVPLKPLAPGAQYVVAYLRGIKDSRGTDIEPSISYSVLRQDISKFPISEDPKNSALALQGVLNNLEARLLEANVKQEDIIYSSVFTTQAATTSLSSLKGLYAKTIGAVLQENPQIPIVPGVPSVGDITLSDKSPNELIKESIASFPETPSGANLDLLLARVIRDVADLDLIEVHKAKMKVDYFLSDTAPLSQPWIARCVSGATLSGLPEGAEFVVPDNSQDEFCKQVGLRDVLLKTADGNTDIDPLRHITKYNPIPKSQLASDSVLDNLNVQITVPRDNFSRPATGWPVVILQHGIGYMKEFMLPLAAELAKQGFATVAIDHPLHGSRKVSFTNDQGNSITANANVSPTDYMNLANLLVARDNLRQSVLDMISLRIGVSNSANIGNVVLDRSKVHFMGQSLGAITGANFVGLANTSVGGDIVDSYFDIQTTALSTPAGGISSFLVESNRFGPIVKSLVSMSYAQGIAASPTDTPLSQFFIAYKEVLKAESKCQDGTPKEVASCIVMNSFALMESDEAAKLTLIKKLGVSDEQAAQMLAGINIELNTVISSFNFAAQTVIDPADPNSYVNIIKSAKTPTLIFEMVGGKTVNDDTTGNDVVNPADRVIPNSVVPGDILLSPIAGSTPFASFIEATAITESIPAGDAELNGIIRYTAGHHASLITYSPTEVSEAPNQVTNIAVNKVIQEHAVEFTKSGGKAVTVSAEAQPFVKAAAAKAEEE